MLLRISPAHWKRVSVMGRLLLLSVLLVACVRHPANTVPPTEGNERADDERAIRKLNATAEAAWNQHNAAAMDSAYVEDCDFVNVFGQFISGRKNLLNIHTALFAGPLRDSYKRFTVEKIRFVRPDVAIVHVRGRSTDRDGKLLGGDEGTIALLVMVKERGKWSITAGQNTEVRPLPEAFKPIGKPSEP